MGKDGKLPKPTPAEQKRQAEEHKANSELARERTESIRTKRLQAQLVLARSRGELISKAVAQQQAEFLIVALRQRILSIPQTYSRRLAEIADYDTMAAALKKMSLSILREIENLPRCVEEGYLDRGEQAAEETPKK